MGGEALTRLDVDFADRGVLFWLYRANLRVCALGLLAGLVLLAGWWEWREVSSDLARLAQERARMEMRQERPKPKTAAQAGLTSEQLKATHAVVRQLNQPWLTLLESLETTRKGRVALLELRFDPVHDRLKGIAEAKNSVEMLRFMSQLKSQPVWGKVELTLHQISQTDPNKPYRFEFSADWRQEGEAP